MKRTFLSSLAGIALLYAHSLFAQDSAFTYQGALSDSNGAVNGNYDLGFSLFCDGCTDPCCRISTNAVAVRNGLFAVTLDFGAGVFNGTTYSLEIAVRTNGGASFT